MDKPIRVLVVDDSAFMRKILTNILDASPDIQVVDKAFNGVFALKKLEKNEIDVITLDLEMPDLDGIGFLTERQKRKIDIPVIIFSSIAHKGAKVTMDALALGASDFILKPSNHDTQDLTIMCEELVKQVTYYGRLYHRMKGKVVKKEEEKVLTPIKPVIWPEQKTIVSEPRSVIPEINDLSSSFQVFTTPVEQITPLRAPGKIEVIALGISTGGPNALRQMLKDLPADFPVPILIVQHMPAGFTREFALSLSKICPLEVKEAADGDIIRKGRILIAPGDKHMQVIEKPLAKIVKLTNGEPMNGHKPSVGVLFLSVAEIYKNNCLAAIMTGMGKDGAKEIGEIYRQGSLTIAQDKDSCVVFGMPKAAINTGVIHHIIPLERMTRTFIELTTES